MTTTGAARNQNILASLRPSIVIVEEAAEIMEAQLIACLHAHAEHLVLIGDHKQLQPSINCYFLERKKDLHISLFERLIRNGFPHQTLGFQRRMHPAISRCVASIYPQLRNHPMLANRHFLLKPLADAQQRPPSDGPPLPVEALEHRVAPNLRGWVCV